MGRGRAGPAVPQGRQARTGGRALPRQPEPRRQHLRGPGTTTARSSSCSATASTRSEAYSKAAELEPSDPRPFTSIGTIYYGIGYQRDALSYYERALTINANYLPALDGAIRAAAALQRASTSDLDRIRLALLIANEPQLRTFYEYRLYTVENRLKSQNEISLD